MPSTYVDLFKVTIAIHCERPTFPSVRHEAKEERSSGARDARVGKEILMYSPRSQGKESGKEEKRKGRGGEGGGLC